MKLNWLNLLSADCSSCGPEKSCCTGDPVNLISVRLWRWRFCNAAARLRFCKVGRRCSISRGWHCGTAESQLKELIAAKLDHSDGQLLSTMEWPMVFVHVPLSSMVFDGSQPLAKRWNGNEPSLWSKPNQKQACEIWVDTLVWAQLTPPH